MNLAVCISGHNTYTVIMSNLLRLYYHVLRHRVCCVRVCRVRRLAIFHHTFHSSNFQQQT
jgi:hypothetical protein